MAYREFHYEKQYAAPDNSLAYQTQIQGLSNLFRGLQARREERARKADSFAYDLDQGAFQNDTMILKELASNVTARAKQELRTSGRISPETERLMKDGSAWQQASKNQMERAKTLRQNIIDRATKDPFYNPEPDLALMKKATHGDNNEVNFYNRGDLLGDAEQNVGGINTFMFDNYKAKYVKDLGTQYKENEFPNRDGSSKTIYDQATFWGPNGKPEVTDQHAIKFIESEGRVAKFYDKKINDQISEEIKAMKATGDDRVSWMNGKSDAEIKDILVNDPSKNLINNKEYGVRMRELAKADLSEADRVNSKVSYTSLQNDDNNSGGLWKNKNILHDDSINSFAQAAKDGDGKMITVNTYGPGGRFTQKSGKALVVDTTNPIRTDINKGITTRNNKGSIRLNMTGYQLMPVRAGMAPFALKSNTPDGMIQEINNIPLEDFDPNGKMKLQDKMKIGLNGFIVNEAGVLNDIQDQLFDLTTSIREATTAGDKEKISSLENMQYNLQELKEMIGSGDYDPQDLLLAGNKAGVRKIQNNMIIPADESDFAAIKNVTGGFDLRNQNYWSPEMKAVNEAYEKRAAEAKAKGYKSGEQPKKITPAEFSQKWTTLKPGDKLTGPDGKVYVKK